MCGIFGMLSLRNGASTWPAKYHDIMEQGLYVTGLRGLDSTGVFTVHETRPQEVYIFKGAIDPMQLCSTKQYGKFSAKHYHTARYIIGHTRKATKGDISWDNAHPFSYKGITLIHNGVMHNTHDFKEMSYDVDSQYIPQILHESSSVPEALGKMSGAFALIWYDARNQSLNIARNNERTLAYYVHKASDRMFIASEPEMLPLVLHRNGILVEPKDLHMFLPNKHYQISETEKGMSASFTYVDGKFKEAPVTVYYGGAGYQNWNNTVQRGGAPTVQAYKPRPWSKIFPTVPVTSRENIPLFDVSLKQAVGNTDRLRVKATGKVYSLTNKNGDPVELDVEIYNVNKKFEKLLNMWRDRYKEGEYGISARPWTAITERDLDADRVIHLDGSSIEGWRLKGNHRIYYSFNNADGTYRKTGIKEEHKVILPGVDKSINTITDLTLFPGPNNTLLTLDDFEKVTSGGCSSCKKTLTVEDANSIDWIDNVPVCDDCMQFIEQYQQLADY